MSREKRPGKPKLGLHLRYYLEKQLLPPLNRYATLLGESNPAARLPTTWYSSISDIGPITDYTMLPAGGKAGRTYRYFDGPVLYPFGEQHETTLVAALCALV